MCGIWGLITQSQNGFAEGDFKYMEDMAILTSLRGSDSSGIFWGSSKQPDSAYILKSIGDPFNILRDIRGDWEKTRKHLFARGKFIIGHGRYATRGKVTLKNAHPFREGHITLVHNGTVDGMHSEAEVEVDSHALTIDIARRGVVPVLSTISGGAALIWHDAKEKALFFYRNSSKDLHYLNGFSKIFIMTEREALTYLFKHNHDYHVLNGDGVKSFEAGWLYRMDVNNHEIKKDIDVYATRHSVLRQPAGNTPWEPHHTEADFAEREVQIPNFVTAPPAPASDITPHRFFTVRIVSVEKDSNNPAEYIYKCVGTRNEQIITRSSTYLTNPVGRTGTAKDFTLLVPKEGPRYFVVRFKDISWDDLATDDHPDVTPQNPGIFVVSRNGFRMNAKTWKHMCEDHYCEGCGEAIDVESVNKCIVLGNKIACVTCANEIAKIAEDSQANLDSIATQLLQRH